MFLLYSIVLLYQRVRKLAGGGGASIHFESERTRQGERKRERKDIKDSEMRGRIIIEEAKPFLPA